MPLSYLRRPLFLALAVYMLALAVLHARGFFEITVPRRQLGWRDDPNLRVEGLVVSPRREDLRGVKFVIADALAGGEPVGTKVLVYLPRGAAALENVRPGRRIALAGALRLPRRPRNPGDFDERAFLSDRGVGWILRAPQAEILPEAVPWYWRPAFWAESVRLAMEASFRRGLEPVDAALMTGLTLGYKAPLPRDLNRAIQDAGAMHLLVPSGAKVAFVLLAVSFLASRLTLPLWARFSLAAALGGFYTLMVGGDPPYARAYLGAVALGMGAWLDRESGAFQAAVLSAWLILLSEPRALFGAGFQMTYAAVAGLLLAMPQVNAALPERWPRWVRGSVCVLAVTEIVQLALWPVFAATFGRGALLGACANIPLVPYSGVLLAAGFVFAGLSAFLPPPAWPLHWGLALFRWTCVRAAALPYAAVDLCPMKAWTAAAYYLGVSSVLVLPRRRAAAVLAAAAASLWLSGLVFERLTAPSLRVVYLSLREPAAVVFARGTVSLVGPGAPAGTVRRALKALGVRRVDRVDPAGEAAPVCEKEVCFGFAPPAVRTAHGEFSIIERLKKSSVEAATDGFRIKIKDAQGRALHQLGGALLQ